MKKVRCPICDKPMDEQGPGEWPNWPFCSRRCQIIDLGRWLGGTYRIESPASAGDMDDAETTSENSEGPTNGTR
jgi:endogenous inhibitor of DNA gyrase (YacG/DUF329 family)